MPLVIVLMLVPSNTVDELVAKVKPWAACIEVIVKELPETAETIPISPSMPPLDGSLGFPEPCVPTVTLKTGVMLKAPVALIITELARLRSNPIAMGVEPTVTGLLKLTITLMGPGIVACTGTPNVGSMYITVAEPIEMLAPV